MRKRYFLSLFAGIGGFDLAAFNAGLRFDGHFYSEIDPYACRVMTARFPEAIALGDITKLNTKELPDGEYVVCGGFPCQDISSAGKGAGLAGSRSGLWYEYRRIVEELRPSIAVIENVGTLVKRGLADVLTSLAEIGYDAEWQDIRASDVGAPHRRERIWIVAYPCGTGLAEWVRERGNAGTELAPAERSCETLADASDGGDVRRDGELEPAKGEVREHRGSASHGSREWWATEPDVGRVAHGVPARVDRLKCLGNSIVPQIAELIFEQPLFNPWRAK